MRIVCAILLVCSGRLAAAKTEGELVFAVGSTSFASSHASTIVQLKNGDLMAAWFGGSAEGAPDVAIWASRYAAHGSGQKSGHPWSTPKEVAREEKIACWNPVLFHTKDGRLWLYYKYGPNPAAWSAARKFSTDEGMTWSAVERLPAGILGPIRAKPLILPGGTIVSGSSVEAYHAWAVWIERSTDEGKSWAKIGPLVPARTGVEAKGETTYGIIQPSVVSLGATHLRLYARSTEQIARVCAADSFDNGNTWTVPHTLDIPNPNSGIDAVALTDGRVVLVYNDTPHGRSPLNLAVSPDGEHFRMFSTLESEPGEYSYPAMIQAGDGSLEITYTWNRKSVRHVHVPLGDVPK